MNINGPQNPIYDNIQADPQLIKRGIAPQAQSMAWQRSGDYWTYPIYNFDGEVLTHRGKNIDSFANPKYVWKPSKLEAKYYHSPHIRQAVADANGILFIANGEPSVLVYLAVGIYNTLSWFGEGAIPETIVDDLAQLNVKRVIYIPDNDDAGQLSAVKLRDALHNTDIRLTIKDISAHVVLKGDTNDLWIDCNNDPDTFKRTIQRMPILPLPAYNPPKLKESHIYVTQPYDNSDAITQIAIALGVNGWATNTEGFTRKLICNPLRDDKNPTAGFNLISGVLHDFNGIDHSPQELAEHFGIEWRNTYSKPLKANNLDSMPSDDCPYAIPDSLRTALIKYGKPSEAVLIEYISKAVGQNLLTPHDFTIKDVVEALPLVGCNLSKSTIRQTLQCKNNIVCQILDTYKDPNKKQVSNFRQYSCTEIEERILLRAKYRNYEKIFGDSEALSKFNDVMLDAIHVDCKQLAELDRMLDTIYKGKEQTSERYKAKKQIDNKILRLRNSFKDAHSTPFPDNWVVNKPSDFKTLFTRAIIQSSDPETLRTRKELCEKIGVSSGGLTHTLSNAGIKNVSSVKRMQITSSAAAKIEAKTHRAYIKGIVINGHYEPFRDNVDSLISNAIDNGHQVEVLLQQPAKQVIVSDSQPIPTPKSSQKEIKVDNNSTNVQNLTANSQPVDNTRKPGKFYEPSYDPQFVYWELAKAIKLLKGYIFRDDILCDFQTGEIVVINPTAQELVNIVLDCYNPESEYSEHDLMFSKWALEIGAEIEVMNE